MASRDALGLLLREDPVVDELLDEALVLRQLAQAPFAEEVGAAVPHLEQVDLRPEHPGDGERGAHALARGVLGPVAEDAVVRGVDRGLAERGHVAGLEPGGAGALRQLVGEGLDGEPARDLPGLGPAHAIRHGEEEARVRAATGDLAVARARGGVPDGGRPEVVLVVLTDLAGDRAADAGDAERRGGGGVGHGRAEGGPPQGGEGTTGAGAKRTRRPQGMQSRHQGFRTACAGPAGGGLGSRAGSSRRIRAGTVDPGRGCGGSGPP